MKHIPKDRTELVIPPDRAFTLDDGNVVELRRVDMDGKVTCGLRIVDKDCGTDAAVEFTSHEAQVLYNEMRVLCR